VKTNVLTIQVKKMDVKATLGREINAIVALENGAFCIVFSENFHKF
jgi:hypothetical protein